jgi:hypothetical protein
MNVEGRSFPRRERCLRIDGPVYNKKGCSDQLSADGAAFCVFGGIGFVHLIHPQHIKISELYPAYLRRLFPYEVKSLIKSKQKEIVS